MTDSTPRSPSFYIGTTSPSSSSSTSGSGDASDEENAWSTCTESSVVTVTVKKKEGSKTLTPRNILKSINNGNANAPSTPKRNFIETGSPALTKKTLPESLPKPKPSTFRELRDLTKLNCITLETVLKCLRERYRCQQYYTYAGPILLSLNSCLRLPRASLIEDVARMSWYFVTTNANEAVGNEGNDEEERAPHVYDIGRRCLKNIINVGSQQVILISGETGAGKTTATQQLIKYLTENNSRNFGANLCSNLDKKIYFATVILESFGNAKTQSNPNSSRFGRLVQLNYNKSSGKITGAEIHTYLLEKHRVAKYDPRFERSFHIFYYLLHSLKNGTIEMPNNLNWNTIRALTPKHMILDDKDECEADEVQRLQNAVMAFNMDEFSEVVNMIFAIISLLNITFVPDCDSSSEDEHSDSSCNTGFTVADWSGARLAADLLHVDPKELVDILIARKITCGSSHRHSIFRKPCERRSECEERLHALTSFVYDQIFSYVLANLNHKLKGDTVEDSNDLCTVSLLDLYGFENFNVNHLEQICINYANERLQQININIVRSYYEQSAPPDEVMIPPTELIRIETELNYRVHELNTNIFGFFDEECLLKRISEDKDVLERMRLNLANKKSRFIQASKPHVPNYNFTVTHYATPVEYQLKGLVQKNKDHIPPEFQDILKSSKNSFIQNLFKIDLIRSRNASGHAQSPKSVFTLSKASTRGKTILTRFKSSVDELMARLTAGDKNDKEIHFIRCIRPNVDLLAGNFCKDVVEKQLHSCGIADVVKIAGNGYPIRVGMASFSKEFPKIMTFFCNGQFKPKRLMTIFSTTGTSTNTTSMRFGKTIVFMSEKCWKLLKKTEKFITLHHARIVQKAWRRKRQEQEEARLKSITILESESLEEGESLDHDKTDADETPATSFSTTEDGSTIVNTSNESTSTLVPRGGMRRRHGPRPLLFFGDGIVSRQPVHTLPIKFYTKKTCLAFVEKPPRRLIANGIPDAFEDYEIVILKS